jgi:hypothetical protein
MWSVIGFAVFLMLLVIIVPILYVLSLKKRQAILQKTADRLGLEFVAEMPSFDFERLSLLTTKSSESYSNLISGKMHGRDIQLFEYQYTVHGLKSAITYFFTVLVIYDDNDFELPTLALHPKSLSEKFFGLIAPNDCKFESDPEFSSRYMLTTVQRKVVRLLFDQKFRDVIFDWPGGLHVEIHADKFLYFRPVQFKNKSIPESVPLFIEAGFAALNLFIAARDRSGAW